MANNNVNRIVRLCDQGKRFQFEEHVTCPPHLPSCPPVTTNFQPQSFVLLSDVNI